MGKKKAKRKKVTVKLLKRMHAGNVTEPYRIMEELIEKYHSNLGEATIALAWRFGWNANADGLMTMGRAAKRSDLDRELAKFDFVILLNHEAWNKGGLNETQRVALIDHELCHCEITYDSDGEPKHDEQGRIVCRIRKHDIEEFVDVVNRHGLYTRDLAAFARKSINDAERPILQAEQKADGGGEGKSAKSLETMLIETLQVHSMKITNRQIKSLSDAGYDTVGKLVAHMQDQGEWWHREVKGIGKDSKVPIEEAVASIQAAG